MTDTIELERGLEFYYSQQNEFERRGLPIEKQVAFGFEAGLNVGRAETKAKIARIFLPENKNEWP